MIATPQSPVAGRYKLKSHVYFGRVDDGIWFEAGSRSFLLRNPRLYPAAEKFIALIDNGHPIDTIMARAPEAVRPLFAALLASLLENEMLQPLGADHVWPRPRTGAVAADELLKLLEDRLGGAALSAAVNRWHSARIAVIGCGHALKAAAGAFAAAGCRDLRIHAEAAPTRLAPGEITAFVKAQAAADAAMRFTAGVPTIDDFAAADLIVYASDAGDAAFARDCGAAVIAGVFAGHACVAPPADASGPGVADMLHWLPAADAGAASHSPTSLAILGCVAAQAGLHSFFGFDQDRRRGQVSVVGPDLQVSIHPLVTRGTSAADSRAFIHAPRHQLPDERTLETFEIVKLGLDPWFDPMFGAFRVGTDDAIRQMPLLQYPIHVRRPGHAAGDGLAIGWGLDLGQAGLRAIADAVALLAAPLLPPGAAFAVGTDAAQWQRAALVAAIVASDGFAAGQRSAWLPLDAIEDGAVRVLRRLIRYHSDAPLRARLHWSGLGAAYGIEIWLGESFAASAIGDDIVAVLAEALGRACSDFQLAQAVGPGFWQSRSLHLSETLSADAEAADWQTAIAGHAGLGELAADYHPLTGLGLPPVLHCGHAVLRSTQAVR